MNNPLEKDVCDCPHAKVSYSKPREPLKKIKKKRVGSGVSFVTEANKQAQQQIKLVMLVCLSTCYCAKWICLYRLYKTNGIEKPYKYHIWQQHLIRWGTGFSRFILTKARWHLCSRPTWSSMMVLKRVPHPKSWPKLYPSYIKIKIKNK